MTPEKWDRIKALFEAALQEEPAARTEFLARACADEDLRKEVEELLAHHQQAGGFLASGDAGDSLTHPKMLGHFTIVEKIGEGGMAWCIAPRTTS
jgi:hypothetical protein